MRMRISLVILNPMQMHWKFREFPSPNHDVGLLVWNWRAGDMKFLIISLVGRQKPVPEFGHAMAGHSHGKRGPLSWDPGNKKKLALTWLSNQAYLFSFYF